MSEITKGKKTDETFMDDPNMMEDQEAFMDDPKEEEKFHDEERQAESVIELEDPPTYDAIAEAMAEEEKKENTKEEEKITEIFQKKPAVCRNCGAELRESDRFCPSCGVKCEAEDVAVTKENDTEQDEAPKIYAEELRKSVEKETASGLKGTFETEKTTEQTSSKNTDSSSKQSDDKVSYTEEERRDQILRMAQNGINYERQIENMTEDEDEEKPKKKVWKIVLGTVAALVGISVVGVYAAGVYHFRDRFFLNTTINGIDVSEDTIENFNKNVGDEIAKYQIAVKERGGVTEYLTSADLGYGYTPKGETEKIKGFQNAFLWPECLFTTYIYTFETSTSYSEVAVEQSVKDMACFQEENVVEPEDAYVTYDGERYAIVPEVEGNLLNQEKVMELVKNAVATGLTEISLEEEDCYIQPDRRQDDAVMNSAVNQLNTYLSTEIEYIFGDNREVLDASVLKNWISFDETTFEVNFDDGKLAEYVAQLASKYDTYDKDRQFTTNDGSVVTVSGGSGYGWMIDQESEVQEVKQWIAEGTQNIRYAVFAKEAESWYNCDLGESYVEIDLTNQHVWLYINGEEIVSSDCVSGDMTIEGRMTPAGTYTLYYKESPSILKGEGYEDGVEVQYWMPFNGGVGLHDASWRSEFGGQIYVSNGSHGCVNLPTEMAKKMYDNIYPGIPIICYYR